MRVTWLPLSWMLLALAATAAGQTTSERVIAEGTPFATKVIVQRAGPGPTVMLIGGVHGNEPSGARAVAQIVRWKLERGTLVCVPHANVLALAADQRRTPDLPREQADLNRQFPKEDGARPVGVLATALWQLVEDTRPDWLLDCHEGFDFTQQNPNSVGSSVIAVSQSKARARAKEMLAAVNADITNESHRFVLKTGPVKGSLARSTFDRLGIPSMILETTTKDQRLPKRTRQHRIMVRRFLRALRMVKGDEDRIAPVSAESSVLHAALFDDVGCNARGVGALEASLAGVEGLRLHRVDGEDVRAGRLAAFDALLVPGGGGSKEAASLGEDGRESVRQFVRDGGGYLGFCAGAYLASSNYKWSLKIIDAQVIDRAHWKRGRGDTDVELTPQGQGLFSTRPQNLEIYYANGPLLAPGLDPQIPDFEALAHFRSEINATGNAPEGVMLGTPAMVRGSFGRGRVFVSSPHPELTSGHEPMVERALRWVCTADGQ